MIPSRVGCHQEKGEDMPLFLCRWPNGDCSVVWAPHKEDEEEIFSFAYPVLDQALSDAYGDEIYDSYETLPPARRAAIATAVETERRRIAGDRTPTAEPLTEIGRDVKKQTDVPTILVDRIVRHVATAKLKHLKGRGKPS